MAFLISRPPEIDNPRYYLGNGAFVLLQPVSATELYVGIVGLPQQSVLSSEESNKKVLKQLLKSFSGLAHVLPDLRNIQQLHVAPIKALSQTAWGQGRVLLIGDAAHACPPALQQGASQALEDVLCLKHVLQKEQNFLKAREEFEGLRSDRVNWVSRHSYNSIQQLCKILTPDELSNRNQIIQDQGPNNFVLWQTLFSSNNLF